MVTITMTDVEQQLEQVIEQARHKPVVIQSDGHNMVVILDHAEFQRLCQLEDRDWIARADAAVQSGFLSPAETMARLLCDAEDIL
jgi:prevent-host-death family protein